MYKIISILLLVSLTACADKYKALAKRYQLNPYQRIPLYSSLDYWAAHPWKHDPSDSIPLPLQQENRDSIADVFFIHPTTYTGSKTTWNALIDDAYLNAKTDYSSILYQATVFNQHCRIFAPRYRQAHLSAFFTEEGYKHPSLDTAYADIRAAFNYYLHHFNKGRPVIIAGHSQGGLMAMRLLKDFFDHNDLNSQLVAAYIIGWPVPLERFKNIPACQDSLQTGCFNTWRTYRTNYIPAYIQAEPAVHVTNPLSWETNDNSIPASFNLGSILKDFNLLVKNTAGAKVNGKVLWTNRPKFPGAFFFRTKNYHIGDINLYYMNIRKNIEQRIFSFMRIKN